MSYMEELFFKVLFEFQGDLLVLLMNGKKYFLLVPPTKCIMQNVLTTSFYENHLFYQSDYDDRIYINLLGKVLELNNNIFQTHLGYKKIMYFNVIDEFIMEEIPNVNIIKIENIIDESMYQPVITSASSIYKKEWLRRCSSREDYLNLFDNLLSKYNELNDVVIKLNETIDKLQNQFILVKDHVTTYSKHFRELGSEYKSYISGRLTKFRFDDSYNTIIYELTESLIFNKMYPFIFLNIKKFNYEDEEQIKIKLNQAKSDFTFQTYNIDPVYNQLNLSSAINELKKICILATPFEKIAALVNVYTAIMKEVNNLNTNKNKDRKGKLITANELIPIWMYIIINSDFDNILTEIIIMQDFMLKDSSLINESGYHLINFINALENYKNKEGENPLKYCIIPTFVTTSKTNQNTTLYEDMRSFSFNSVNEPRRSESEAIFSKLNIFK